MRSPCSLFGEIFSSYLLNNKSIGGYHFSSECGVSRFVETPPPESS